MYKVIWCSSKNILTHYFYFSVIVEQINISAVEPLKLELDSICGCREIAKPESNGTLHSKCGESATARGPGQQVFSFVMYGPFRKGYYNGIQQNLNLMKELFPGYVMRVYHDRTLESDDMPKLCQLFCQEPLLDLCSVVHEEMKRQYGDLTRHFGMIWRFIPMADPLVKEWHSRDLDSRLSEREKAALLDWRDNSHATYHVMRDNPFHNTRILGGMFGMKLGKDNGQQMTETLNEMLNGSFGLTGKGTDQYLLSKYLWPKAFRDMVVHDSYSCRGFKGPEIRPFVTKRNSSDDFKDSPGSNFVGANGGRINLFIVGPCPVECRPKEHKDWLLC